MTAVRTKEERPKEYSIPSLEKNGELALCYNLAYNRINQFIFNHFSDDEIAKYPSEEKDFIRVVFFHETNLKDVLEKDGQPLTDDNGKNLKTITDLQKPVLNDETYALFKELILKEKVGANIYATPSEIDLINKIILTLLRVRDYHSHYFHENTKMLDDRVARFLQDKLAEAKGSYPDVDGKKIDFEVIEEQIDGKYKNKILTEKGVNFFLSFFLTRSLMQLFMAQREHLVRDGVDTVEDGTKIDFHYHRFLCTRFALKDGFVNQSFLEKKDLPDIKKEEYLGVQLKNHLSSVPYLIYPKLKNEVIPTTIVKRENKFLKLVAAWLSLRPDADIAWEVISTEYERIPQTKPQKGRQVPAYYVKKIKKFQESIGTDPEPFAEGGKICLKIKISANKFAEIHITEKDMVYLTYLAAYQADEYSTALARIKAFAKEYAILLDCLWQGKKYVLEDSILQKYIGSKEDRNANFRVILKTLLEKSDDLSTENWSKKTEELVLAKVQQKIGWLKTGEPAEYGAVSTEVFTTTQLIKNKLNDKARKDFTDEDTAELKAWLDTRKKYKAIRHKKMQVILICKAIVLGSRGKFLSQTQKEDFCTYAYSLDFKHDKRNDSLIKDWQKRLFTLPKPSDKNPEPSHDAFKQEFFDTLTQSKDFDTFYSGVLKLTEKYLTERVLNKAGKMSDNAVHYYAKTLGINNLSLTESRNQSKRNAKIRKQELLEPFRFYNKKTQQTTYFGTLPTYFFKIEFANILPDKILQTLKDKPYYQQTKTQWENMVEADVLPWFADFKTLLADKKSNKEAIKNAKKLHNELLQDCLLHEISEQIYKGNQSQWQFTAEGLYCWEIDSEKGIKILCKPNEIKANDNLLQGSRIRKIIAVLQKEEPTKTEFTLAELKQAIRHHWYQSRKFLSEVLLLEKTVLEKESFVKKVVEKKMFTKQLGQEKLRYVPIGEVSKKLNHAGKYKLSFSLKAMRNLAFHGDILTDKTYQDLIIELKKCVEESKK